MQVTTLNEAVPAQVQRLFSESVRLCGLRVEHVDFLGSWWVAVEVYVGGNIVCCDKTPVRLRICIANLPRQANQEGDWASTFTFAIMRGFLRPEQLVREMQC